LSFTGDFGVISLPKIEYILIFSGKGEKRLFGKISIRSQIGWKFEMISIDVWMSFHFVAAALNPPFFAD
jgi:hypothetical protein